MRPGILFSAILLAILGGCAAEKESPQTESTVPYLTSANFDQEVYESEIPVLVDFTATWCGPCKIVDPIVESLATEMEGRAKIVKIDIDETPDVYQELRVNGVPTVIFFNNGMEEDRISSPQERETYVHFLEAMIGGESGLSAALTLLNDDSFRRHFLLSREIEAIEEVLAKRPGLVTDPFENGQTPLSLILNRPSVRQNALVDLVLSHDPEILPRELVGLGRCDELAEAISRDPEVASAADPDGATPLYVALLRGRRLENGGCLQTLLAGGADPSRAQNEAHSLNWAVILEQDLGLLEELLDKGLNPEASNSEGMNALHFSVLYGIVDSAELLIRRGIDLTAKTDKGQTAEDMARERREASVKRLEESDSPEAQAAYTQRVENLDALLALLAESPI